MHDPANGLRGIPLLRTPVNKGQQSPVGVWQLPFRQGTERLPQGRYYSGKSMLQ
jgi:hypothetical protein